MSVQAVSRRNIGLVEKRRRIDDELASFREAVGANMSTMPREIREILICIHHHLFETDLNVQAVRTKCRLRNNNVSSRFRKIVGLGLREYIEALRLHAADRLLRVGACEVYLVAMAVGYVHQETFCRAFQRHFGCVPSERRCTELSSEPKEQS
jgi:transcriptional regulator GlxA family with amidase domain